MSSWDDAVSIIEGAKKEYGFDLSSVDDPEDRQEIVDLLDEMKEKLDNSVDDIRTMILGTRKQLTPNSIEIAIRGLGQVVQSFQQKLAHLLGQDVSEFSVDDWKESSPERSTPFAKRQPRKRGDPY